MSNEVTLRLRDNGPLLVQGTVQLLDADGKPFALPADKPMIAICRCGRSQKKDPFCDGQHKQCGFESAERAT